jgi:hypothetical protein
MSTPRNTAVITSSHTKGTRFLHGTHTSSQEGMSFLQQRHASIHTDGHRHLPQQWIPLPTQRRLCPSPQYGLYSSSSHRHLIQRVSHLLDADDHSLDSCQVRGQAGRMVVMFASMVVMPARLRSDSIQDMVEQSRPCQMGYSAGVRLHTCCPTSGRPGRRLLLTEPHIPVSQPAHGSAPEPRPHGRAQFPCLSLSSPWSSP